MENCLGNNHFRDHPACSVPLTLTPMQLESGWKLRHRIRTRSLVVQWCEHFDDGLVAVDHDKDLALTVDIGP